RVVCAARPLLSLALDKANGAARRSPREPLNERSKDPRPRLNDFSKALFALTPRHWFEFGPFRAALLTHRLLRNGEVVALQPKAFDTLVVLIQNRGRVVE